MGLILERTVGQRIVIGDRAVVLTLTHVTLGGKARIRIDAPGYSVHREETYHDIKHHNRLDGRQIFQPTGGNDGVSVTRTGTS